jgi:hypothetical protein
VDPLEEHIGDSARDYGPTLVTVDEWPYDEPMGRWTHFRHKVLSGEEVRSVDGGHIVRHDPARVLREVEAKRAILGLLDSARAAWEAAHQAELDSRDANLVMGISEGRAANQAWAVYQAMNAALPLLATPYADHPDYRPEWSPETVTPSE